MLSDGLAELSVFSTCSTFVMPWVWRVSILRTWMDSEVSALTLLINEPVTTISCNSGAALADAAGPAVAEAVVCELAVVPVVAVVPALAVVPVDAVIPAVAVVPVDAVIPAVAVVAVDAVVCAVAVVAAAANAMSVRRANLSLFVIVIRSFES
jgi:Na+/pantothenate symporter